MPDWYLSFFMTLSYTLIIILITAVTSVIAFSNQELNNKLILYPKLMHDNPASYYRLLTSGFIHADWMHLFFNMYSLYFVGQSVERIYEAAGLPIWSYPTMYLLGIVVASLPSFFKHKDNYYYRSLGASGGVAAVIFSFIYFAPWATLGLFFIKMPAILFAIIYLAYSAYAAKKGGDYINHDAHFWGSVFGFVFTLIFAPDHGLNFLDQLMHPSFF